MSFFCPYLQLCEAPTRKQPQQTAAGGRAACTLPQRGRTCGGTGPAGPTAATGGLSGPSAPADPRPRYLRGPPLQCGRRGWRVELQEGPGAASSHLGSCSLFLFFILICLFGFTNSFSLSGFSSCILPFLFLREQSMSFNLDYSFDSSRFYSLPLLFHLVYCCLPFCLSLLEYSLFSLYLL